MGSIVLCRTVAIHTCMLYTIAIVTVGCSASTPGDPEVILNLNFKHNATTYQYVVFNNGNDNGNNKNGNGNGLHIILSTCPGERTSEHGDNNNRQQTIA